MPAVEHPRIDLAAFADLAELGVNAQAYADALGIQLEALDAACIKQWGETAQDVAEKLRSNGPVRLMARAHKMALGETGGDRHLVTWLLEHAIRNAPKRDVKTTWASLTPERRQAALALIQDPATRAALRQRNRLAN